MFKKLKNYDYILMFSPIVLASFGIIMIYSASMVTAVVEGHESTYYLVKQAQWFVISLVGFILFSVIPYKKYEKYMVWNVVIALAMLLGVLLFGTSRGNATRWISVGPVLIQPAEFVKLGIILYLASVYSKKQHYIDDFRKGVLPPLILTAFILALIVLQPDIGSAVTTFLVACAIIFSSGMRYKHIILLGFVSILVVAAAIPSMVTEERISRFTGAYQPFADPENAGHHLIQSYLAIGGGGITGEGLGQSVQKLGFLFGAHTDFIMAVIAEELGTIGVLLVLGLLALIVLRGLYVSLKCRDSFGALIAVGISSMIGIQTFINLGSISGILPITGITLPFVSYGGSSLLILMVSMGILNNIASTLKKDEQDSADSKPVQHVQNNKFVTYRGGRKWSS
ncbi:MAG TPA: FtsW/RodA/SpoVE family cell cycle protein [Cerasibacillus sp.]|uniref:FtsW/RodA/SpoVE family cell cycle protein n=1 Tax=Cerasibacillus sp. TaxID=2498711 RepID=UPI002F42FB97